MSSTTIKQWQEKPILGKTALLKASGTHKCGQCRKTKTSGDVVVCTTSKTVDIFCYGCWDSVEWTCHDCRSNPADSEIIGCECCGQWVHNNCSVYIDAEAEDGYVCMDCQTSDAETLKVSLYNKNAELTCLAAERAQLISKMTVLQQEHTQRHADIVRDVATFEKKNIQLDTVVASLHKANKSMKQRHRIEKEALTRELSDIRSTTPVLEQLTADCAHYKSRFETTTICLNNAKQQLRNVHGNITASRARAETAEKQLQEKQKKERKRQREFDMLVDVMEKVVKKSRQEWSTVAPAGLTLVEKELWGQFSCKSRPSNGHIQYTGNIRDIRSGATARFDTRSELFQALGAISLHNINKK